VQKPERHTKKDAIRLMSQLLLNKNIQPEALLTPAQRRDYLALLGIPNDAPGRKLTAEDVPVVARQRIIEQLAARAPQVFGFPDTPAKEELPDAGGKSFRAELRRLASNAGHPSTDPAVLLAGRPDLLDMYEVLIRRDLSAREICERLSWTLLSRLASVMPVGTVDFARPTPGARGAAAVSLAPEPAATNEQKKAAATRPAAVASTESVGGDWRRGEARAVLQKIDEVLAGQGIDPLRLLKTHPRLMEAYILLKDGSLTNTRIQKELRLAGLSHVSKMTRRTLEVMLESAPPGALNLAELRQTVRPPDLKDKPPEPDYVPADDCAGRQLSAHLEAKYEGRKTEIVQQAADELGVSISTVWRMLRGTSHPHSERILQRLLRYAELPADEAQKIVEAYRTEYRERQAQSHAKAKKAKQERR